jgi:hypothetical protein
MNQLKQNPFWVAIALAAVVLLGGFFYFVFRLFGKQSSLQNQLSGRDGRGGQLRTLDHKKMPGDPDIKAWREYWNAMVSSYGEVTDFYTKTNAHLERWFPGLPENPARDQFIARYGEEIAKLETRLKEKGIRIGAEAEEGGEKKVKYGFNWEIPDPAAFNEITSRGQPGDVERVLREIQKRFWARERVANALLVLRVESDGKIRARVHDFRFFKRLHDRIQNAPWEGAPTGPDHVFYQGVGADPGMGVPRGYSEYALPGELGSTLTFGFSVELPYSQVPVVIREILNPPAGGGANQRLLVNVLGTHVTIHDQNQPVEEIVYYRNNPQEKDQKVAAIKEKVKAREVMLTVSCQMIDFEPSKVKKFEPRAVQ